MTVKIEELSEEDLQKKIDNLKAERERTAETLAKYEAALEERKSRLPLGVPSERRAGKDEAYFYIDRCGLADETHEYGVFCDLKAFENKNYFQSRESAKKHAEMLLAWRKGLVANAKGEPIGIEVLKPFLRKGWVAMDPNGSWYWFDEKPFICWSLWKQTASYEGLRAFNIKPAEDWKNSLQECGL